VFIVSKDHPLANQAALTKQDLYDYPIITSEQTPKAEARWFFGRALGTKSPKPKHEPLRFPLTEAIIDAARAGMGIAVMSEWIASSYLDDSSDLVLKRLNQKPLRRPWRIAYRKEMAEAAKRLASALERAAPRVYCG
jgi:LysR family transcriptional regulator, regulator for metE and metH